MRTVLCRGLLGVKVTGSGEGGNWNSVQVMSLLDTDCLQHFEPWQQPCPVTQAGPVARLPGLTLLAQPALGQPVCNES